MLRLLFSRLLQLPLILAVIFVVTFTLAWVVPGSPIGTADRSPPPEIEAAMKRQYNLDNPWRFAGQYLRGVFTRGDFGPSLRYLDLRVADIIRDGLPVSAAVGLAALIFALALGLFAGILGAIRPGSPLDMTSLALALVGVSLPTFVTGSLLLTLFVGVLRWFPFGGWDWPGGGGVAWFSPTWFGQARVMLAHIALPAVTLGLAPAAYIASLIRLGLLDALSADFVRTARAKGVPPHKVVLKHALKVAFLPVLSFLGPAAAITLTGSFVVEKVFNIPGMGDHFVNAVLNKDQFLILGVVLVYSTILIVFNLMVDIAYAWLDPRIEI